MTRVALHLTDNQLRALRRLSRQTGIPVAECVRRAIEMLLKKEKVDRR